jgi:hypothetical protein
LELGLRRRERRCQLAEDLGVGMERVARCAPRVVGERWPCRGHGCTLHRALVSRPAALALHVVARILAETGRTKDEDFETVRTALVAAPRSWRDAHDVLLLELDDLVVERRGRSICPEPVVSARLSGIA